MALPLLADAAYNSAVGYLSLSSNVTGDQNTAVGAYSLVANTVSGNTAYGAFSLTANTTGSANTALGVGALYQNTTGYANTAAGIGSLTTNTTGASNTAYGVNSLEYNDDGSYNTGVGDGAMAFTSGSSNVAVGNSALLLNAGSNNVAIGSQALGRSKSGNSNIAVGTSAGTITTGSNCIVVGSAGVKNESGVTRIGTAGKQVSTYMSGISGVTVSSGVGVIIDTNGHLGTITSSVRYKEAVKPMKDASDVILSLKPVTFRYKKELDPNRISQFGLVAEDVAKVDPELVARDEQGKPYTVRYEAVNAMLLNEFLKEHQRVKSLEQTIGSQQKALELQQEQIDQLRTAIGR